MININMPKNYWQVLNKSLNIAKSFYNLDFKNGFLELYTNAFAAEEEIINIEKCADKVKEVLLDNKEVIPQIPDLVTKINVYLNEFKDENKSYNFTKKDLLIIAKQLDFVIRIWLGQWENFQDILWVYKNADGEPLTSVFYMPYYTEHEIISCRNRMLPIFVQKGICNPGASFGIYSDVLHDDIRILYGICKAFSFAVNGNPSDRDIVKNCDVLVRVEFPYKESFKVTSYEATKEWLDKHPVPGFVNDFKKSYTDEATTKSIYVYLNDYCALLVEPGDEIFVCENKHLEIKKNGKLYTYNNCILSKGG